MTDRPIRTIESRPLSRWNLRTRTNIRPATVQCGRYAYHIRCDEGLLRSATASLAREPSKQNIGSPIASNTKKGEKTFVLDSPVLRKGHSLNENVIGSRISSEQALPQFSNSSIYSSKADGSAKPELSRQLSSTDSWAQKLFFPRSPRKQKVPITLNSWSWESNYVPHRQSEIGRPSIEWMRTVSPSQWPREAIRPNTGKATSLTDSRYLQSLNTKITDALEGRTALSTTMEEKEMRRRTEIQQDETVVRGLITPQAGVREQLLEEILRQLQGDGPMEKLQERLTVMDRKRKGTVGIEDFRTALNDLGEKSVLQERHYNFLLEQAGTNEDAQGKIVVHYQHFLELLRLARNRFPGLFSTKGFERLMHHPQKHEWAGLWQRFRRRPRSRRKD